MALISPRVVEQQYGITATQLRRWRRLGIGPEYFQFTSRTSATPRSIFMTGYSTLTTPNSPMPDGSKRLTGMPKKSHPKASVEAWLASTLKRHVTRPGNF